MLFFWLCVGLWDEMEEGGGGGGGGLCGGGGGGGTMGLADLSAINFENWSTSVKFMYVM